MDKRLGKFEKRELLKVLFQVCVFRADASTKMAHNTHVHDISSFKPFVFLD